MEEMIGEVSKSVQAKPWLLAAAGLAVGLFFFSMVAGARVLSHLAPKLGALRPVTIQLTPVPPSCEGPSLTIGTTQFQVQSFVPAEGELAAPGLDSGVAYWAEGTEEAPVFVLPPLPANQSLLAALRPGDPAVVVWENCNTASYTLAAMGEFPADPGAWLAQDEPQLAVLLPPGVDSRGAMVSGGLEGQELLAIPTLDPEETGVQAEVSLLEAGPSEDGASFEAQVSVYNYGEEAFELTQADVALVPAVGTALAAQRSRPGLPAQVRPGETKEFTFSFPPPGAGTATLRVLGVEYEVAP